MHHETKKRIQYSLKSESGAVKPEVFDTNEPFTDDSDEIEWDVADYENNEDLMYGQSRLHEEVK